MKLFDENNSTGLEVDNYFNKNEVKGEKKQDEKEKSDNQKLPKK